MFLTLTWLAFFSRTLFASQVYFLDDLKIIYYPLEHVYAQFQSNWQLPQWSPLFGFGQPLLGWGQLGFFTPLHIVLRFFEVHPIALLQTSIVSYYAFGLFGMYIFLRRLKLSQIASVLGAVVYTFSGFQIGHLNHVNFYTATMVLPWLLLTINGFTEQPTLRRAALLSLATAAMIVSGQPQIILYTIGIAAVYGLSKTTSKLFNNFDFLLTLKIVAFSTLTVYITFALSSFAILPLAEFLPLTERNEDLPTEVLYEFSYPPWHAITLIAPYFFGDHQVYWGAKSFQELAAYTGIVPLLFAAVALVRWRDRSVEITTAVILLVVGITCALGRYSPLYVYLVEEHLWPSLTVPGRFVFLITTGLAILAACGVDTIRTMPRLQLRVIVSSILFLAAILAPFFWYISTDERAYWQLTELVSAAKPEALLAVIGIIAYFVTLATTQHRRTMHVSAHITVSIATATLIYFGWNYNPLTPTEVAFAPSPFQETLQHTKPQPGIPPRLYSHETLLTDPVKTHIRRTDPLSPTMSIQQAFTATYDNLSCIELSLEIDHRTPSTIEFALYESLTAAALRRTAVKAMSLNTPLHKFCFEAIKESGGKKLTLTLSSLEQSSVRVLYEQVQPGTQEPLYLIRVANPTKEELERSQKEAHLIVHQQFTAKIDHEVGLLARHLNAIAKTSSARWIGALSIKPYRQFIEQFFANDRDEIFDGDHKHTIERYRTIYNMAGVTHFTQELAISETDNAMLEAGFERITRTNVGLFDVALYRNPQAFPKAYVVPNAIFKPGADEVRYAMLQSDYDPRSLVYIDSPIPPSSLPLQTTEPLNATATITRYEPTRVDVEVATPADAILVLTDAATPQWQTYVDNIQQNQLVANTMFRAVLVPTGSHTVSFRFVSPAIENAKRLTLGGAVITAIMLTLPTQLLTASSKRNTGLKPTKVSFD